MSSLIMAPTRALLRIVIAFSYLSANIAITVHTAYIGGHFFQNFLDGASRRVLEIGSRESGWSQASWEHWGSLRAQARANWEYVGADLSAGEGVDKVVADLSKLPFPTGFFDAVIFNGVQHTEIESSQHSDTFWNSLAEMCRVLTIGGHLLVLMTGGIHSAIHDSSNLEDQLLASALRNGHDRIFLIENFSTEESGLNVSCAVAVFRKGVGALDESPWRIRSLPPAKEMLHTIMHSPASVDCWKRVRLLAEFETIVGALCMSNVGLYPAMNVWKGPMSFQACCVASLAYPAVKLHAVEPPLDMSPSELAQVSKISQVGMWLDYYNDAESSMDSFWADLIFPLIERDDFSRVLEIAAGACRNTEKLLKYADQVIVTDIDPLAIDLCKSRFQNRPEASKIEYLVVDGLHVPLPDESISFAYQFDAGVHFHHQLTHGYVRELRRLLIPGGTAFYHHSNLRASRYPLEHQYDALANVFGRSNFSRAHMRSIVYEQGLEMLCHPLVDWGWAENLDAFAHIRKPLEHTMDKSTQSHPCPKHLRAVSPKTLTELPEHFRPKRLEWVRKADAFAQHHKQLEQT